MTVILAAIFATVCFGVAIKGFLSLSEIADEAQRADGWGFAWFWTFLGAIAAACGGLGLWLVRSRTGEDG